MTLNEIRRRPTLPGRFQPSTISVLRLNFCVRDGNRWIPQAIVTGNQTGFGSLSLPPFFLRRISHTTASRLPLKDFASEIAFCFPLHPASGFAPSKPHRSDCSRSDQDLLQSFTFSHKLPSRFRDSFPAPRFALASPVPCSLIPVPSSKIKPSTD